MKVEYLAEGVTLYCGDCREILQELGTFDAVVTDPPYGIGFSAYCGRAEKVRKDGRARASNSDWDAITFEAIGEILAKGKKQAVWGGQLLLSRAVARLARLVQTGRASHDGEH